MAERPPLGAPQGSFLNIQVVEPRILEKLLHDVNNFDFIRTSKHNFC